MKLLFIPGSGSGKEAWIYQTEYFADSEAIAFLVILRENLALALMNMWNGYEVTFTSSSIKMSF